jgi:phosphate acetyltransferase
MLSFSTKGSARTASTEKVAAAVELARHIAVKAGAEMSVDGEMQADAALDVALAGIKMGESHVGGRANVLVFPDLNSGNISVKLVQMLADCESYGQMFLGFTKPAADLPRGCTPQGIVAMAALVGLQAIEYRKLYPAEDPGSDA